MAPPYKHYQITPQAVYNAVRSYMMNKGVPAPQFEELVKMHARAFKMTIDQARADLIAHLRADLAGMMKDEGSGGETLERDASKKSVEVEL